jgi:hypothetical protein
MIAAHHLTQRVAWHDNGWNGTICSKPSGNPYCIALEEIYKRRQDALEDALSGSSWQTLDQEQLPPCIGESGGFMNATEWTRVFVHPYANVKKAQTTHGQLLPTPVTVPEYSTFAVPFAWMLRSEQEQIDERTPEFLPRRAAPLSPTEPRPAQGYACSLFRRPR